MAAHEAQMAGAEAGPPLGGAALEQWHADVKAHAAAQLHAQTVGCLALSNLSYEITSAERIVRRGGVAALLAALSAHGATDRDVCEFALSALCTPAAASARSMSGACALRISKSDPSLLIATSCAAACVSAAALAAAIAARYTSPVSRTRRARLMAHTARKKSSCAMNFCDS